VPWVGWWTEKGQKYVLQVFRALGLDGEFDSEDDVQKALTCPDANLDQNEVELVVEHEEFESRGRLKLAAKVRWVNVLKGVAGQ
jgi:hypothetical protein